LSSRLRGNAPNSFNRIYLDKRTRQVTIERWEYSESCAAFERSAEFHCDCLLSATPSQDRGFSP
ncbi:MAG TPA: hypothetical protein DIW52_10995, partial [Pseudomonas sp.]|nr:hypothetical protein [Pseudomonas sp.]